MTIKDLAALCFSVLQNLVLRLKLIFYKRNVLNLFRRALKQGYPDSKERLIEEIAHVLVSSSVVARIYDINEDDIVNEINKKADKYGFCRVKGVNKK